MEEFGDGFDGEIDGLDASFDYASDEAWAERDQDDVARLEFLVGRIGKDRATSAENFCRNHLEKHGSIIACSEVGLRLWWGIGDFVSYRLVKFTTLV